ncbi:hypothetical protein SAMN05216337_104291 [Bradyrhizobium brasilense]|uniref:Apea-like HEPN domain-containing protein n=1 Tax=Bradyrhizobium brasilense TaxID=1419277 RepID=A0A1G7HQA2_9BRAD|nr:hypothetical protein [Bradyrhizobium brasilense]SDF02516.1 hypothetical protein SAMN05216337_104291 [Bradyrhizobium brasilense]
MQSLADLSYEFRASSIDFKALMSAMRYQRENSYDAIARMRLEGVDADGVSWACGYTVPYRWNLNEGRFEGELQSLICDDASETAARISSTELIYSVDRHHPLALAMGGTRTEKNIDMLGSTITFSYDRQAACVKITAPHSEQLPPTYTERWLVEPFRIMFGQPAMPRLYARNLGGRSIICVSTVPQVKNAVWSAFWRWGDSNAVDFFECYSQFLNLVALARDDRGHPSFEPHPITRFYDELGQVALGSRWVMALTLASASEGLIKLLRPTKPTASNKEKEMKERNEKEALIQVIEQSEASERLRGTATRAVRYFSFDSETTADSLRRLKGKSVVTSAQLAAWNQIRHSVMHGTLISPFSHEEEDKKLSDLVELVHALTRELVRTTGSFKPT